MDRTQIQTGYGIYYICIRLQNSDADKEKFDKESSYVFAKIGYGYKSDMMGTNTFTNQLN